MSDKYDEAIAYLTERPEHINDAWCVPDYDTPQGIAQAHCLFQYATPTGGHEDRPDGERCGCLTIIRQPPRDDVAWTDELTEAILKDKRIPDSIRYVRVADLPVFAEWQRRLDRELQRTT